MTPSAPFHYSLAGFLTALFTLAVPCALAWCVYRMVSLSPVP